MYLRRYSRLSLVVTSVMMAAWLSGCSDDDDDSSTGGAAGTSATAGSPSDMGTAGGSATGGSGNAGTSSTLPSGGSGTAGAAVEAGSAGVPQAGGATGSAGAPEAGGAAGSNGGTEACTTYALIDPDISSDTTLHAGCYRAEQTVTVEDGATLTLESGVLIQFAQDVGLNIQGALHAVGTEEDPILLTGAQKTRGYWDSVLFYATDSTDNQLDHVIIEYGGAETCNGADTEANLCIYTGGTRVSVKNTTLRESAGIGMYAAEDATITAFSNNVLTGNETGAAMMAPEVVGSLEESSTFSGNDVDYLRVMAGSVEMDQTWATIDVPYLMQGDVDVNAHLTIAEGNTLTFEQDRSLWVYDEGALTAVGTAAAPIVMTGRQKTAGYWDGLGLYATDSTDNQLNHVVIEYGGAETCNGADTEANLCIYAGGTRVSVKNTTLRGSAGIGMYAAEDATITSFSNNVLTGNETGAAMMAPEVVGSLEESSTFSGNDVDYLRVMAGSVETDQTWATIDVPYLMQGDVDVNAHLTIAEGNTLAFEQDRSLWVYDEGALTAVGTAAAPIVMTGRQETAGYWDGLGFYDTDSTENRLSYVTIEYGGAATCNGANTETNLCLYPGGVRINVSHTTLRHGVSCGVYVGEDTTVNNLASANNTYTDNETDVCQ